MSSARAEVRSPRPGLGRRALQQGVKSAAAGVDVLRRRDPGVLFLVYHRVGARTDAFEIDLPRDLFRAQIAEIATRATTIDRALAILANKDAARRAGAQIVVTFDDGTVDFVDEALPILVEYQVPAILYVATAHVDEGRPFPHSGRPLSWQAVRDATSTGLVTIGSHTHTHALLDRCPPPTAREELDRSIALIRTHVGEAPRHFAYPKALGGSPATRGAIAERFESAALAGTRTNRPGQTDPQKLARSPIQRSDGMRWFRHKARGGMTLEDDMRRVANRWRYAGTTS